MQIDTLITNGTILTMDSDFTTIKDGVLAIKDDAIIYVGNAEGCLLYTSDAADE